MSLLCTTNGNHEPVSGSVAAVAEAVRRGDDLRRFSTFQLEGTGLVEETMTLQTTWVFDDDHVGGLQTLRHPVEAGLGASMQPTWALWIFNVAASQRSAFIPLDGQPMPNATGKWTTVENDPYGSEAETHVPKQYHWWTRSGWKEICIHDQNGDPSLGSWEDIRKAANDGCIFKVGIKNLWTHLAPRDQEVPDHEVFVECATDFAHIDDKFVGSLTQPTFLLQPCTPLRFIDERFRPGWLVVRSDGRVQRLVFDPATMNWERAWDRHAIRWFARS